MPTLVSIFEVEPLRIGGTETFARELSCQLAERGWKSVLCFQSEPNWRSETLSGSAKRFDQRLCGSFRWHFQSGERHCQDH